MYFQTLSSFETLRPEHYDTHSFNSSPTSNHLCTDRTFQAEIREFNSICVSSCPLVNQEKTTFQKLKIADSLCNDLEAP